LLEIKRKILYDLLSYTISQLWRRKVWHFLG